MSWKFNVDNCKFGCWFLYTFEFWRRRNIASVSFITESIRMTLSLQTCNHITGLKKESKRYACNLRLALKRNSKFGILPTSFGKPVCSLFNCSLAYLTTLKLERAGDEDEKSPWRFACCCWTASRSSAFRPPKQTRSQSLLICNSNWRRWKTGKKWCHGEGCGVSWEGLGLEEGKTFPWYSALSSNPSPRNYWERVCRRSKTWSILDVPNNLVDTFVTDWLQDGGSAASKKVFRLPPQTSRRLFSEPVTPAGYLALPDYRSNPCLVSQSHWYQAKTD